MNTGPGCGEQTEMGGQGAMSDRQQREVPLTTPVSSNDNLPHGWFDDASAYVEAARMGGGMPEVQWSEPPTKPVGFWRTLWQRWRP